MDWLQIGGWIVAVVAVLVTIPMAVHYRRHISKERASEKQEIMQRIRERLQLVVNAIADAENYRVVTSTLLDTRPGLKKGTRKRLSRLQNLANDFWCWLSLAEDLVSATMFKAAYYDGTCSQFSQKMDQTGRGRFHDLLWWHFRFHILNGQCLTIPWVRDNCQDFYEELMKAGGKSDLENVLKCIGQVAQNRCLQDMREKQQEFLQVAHQTVDYLKRLAGEQ